MAPVLVVFVVAILILTSHGFTPQPDEPFGERHPRRHLRPNIENREPIVQVSL